MADLGGDSRNSSLVVSAFFTVSNVKVMLSHVSVCPQGGVCLSACWDAPSGADNPLEQTPTPPPQQTATVADGTHPTGMHSCYIFKKFSAMDPVMDPPLHVQLWLRRNAIFTHWRIQGGLQGRAPPTAGSKFFHFHAVFGKTITK